MRSLWSKWASRAAICCERAGCAVVSGLDLLVGQALLQIELMTGHSVASKILYAALESERAERQHMEDC